MSRPSLIKADRERAAAAARKAEKARQPDVPSCSICGARRAPYGFGFGALHACQAVSCRAACEARAYPTETERAA